jgi:hypothetical protein
MATGTLSAGMRYIDPYLRVEFQTRTRTHNPPRVEVYTHAHTRGRTREPA